MQPLSVGKLKSLGVHQLWHAPLLLPTEYRDFTSCCTTIYREMINDDNLYLLRLNKVTNLSDPAWVGPKKKTALTSFVAQDSNQLRIKVIFFGNSTDYKPIIDTSNELLIYGKISYRDGSVEINTPEIIPFALLGKIDPTYPGKARQIKPETTKLKISEIIDSYLNETVVQIRNLFGIKSQKEQDELFIEIGEKPISLKSLIYFAHYPRTINEAEINKKILIKLATKFALQVARSNADDRINPSLALPVMKDVVDYYKNSLPFRLAADQDAAVQGTIKSLSKPSKTLVSLSGDVGSGKTAIFGIVAACCAHMGAKVAILAPNTILCEQIYNELTTYWPLFTFEKVWGLKPNAILSNDASIYIGTTSLLNRSKKQNISFNLVIVDEEHRFSRAQKDELISDSTNYISSTATPIPRTLQLATMGAFDVFRIKSTHIKKEIHSKIILEDQFEEVLRMVDATVRKGFQALIVLPIAEGEGREKETAEEAFQYWNNMYPGKVGLAHGKLKNDEKTQVIEAMKRGELSILCATTVIEVGITIPNARTMVVMHPETLGLSQLHQLRGRLARLGGIGYFLMYLPQFVGDKTFARLKIMEKEIDGFKIAEEDLKLRGFGDLAPNAEKQTGGMPSLLPGYEVTVNDVAEVQKEIEAYNELLENYKCDGVDNFSEGQSRLVG